MSALDAPDAYHRIALLWFLMISSMLVISDKGRLAVIWQMHCPSQMYYIRPTVVVGIRVLSPKPKMLTEDAVLAVL